MRGFGRDNISTSLSIKERLSGLCQIWRKRQVSPKKRLNAVLSVSGLEWAFAPNVVLESLVETEKGPKVLMSDRKGRILAECKPSRKALESGQKMRFTSPWMVAHKMPLKPRAGKLSYILDLISRFGLLEEAIKPLSRFFSQFLKLRNKDFKGLSRSVCAVYSSKFKLGRNLRHSFVSYGKPTLCGGQSSPLGEARAPQWCWTDRRSANSRYKTWKAT